MLVILVSPHRVGKGRPPRFRPPIKSIVTIEAPSSWKTRNSIPTGEELPNCLISSGSVLRKLSSQLYLHSTKSKCRKGTWLETVLYLVSLRNSQHTYFQMNPLQERFYTQNRMLLLLVALRFGCPS